MMQRHHVGLPHQWQGHMREKVRERLPRRGYTFERAGLMSAANLPCLTTFATECYPLGGCTFLIPRAISPLMPIPVDA